MIKIVLKTVDSYKHKNTT